jgi:DNA polymerase-3 subunit gamma/tau
MRDALSLLDQLIAFGGGALNETNARAMLGTIDRGHVSRLVEALSRADGPALLAEVGELDRDAPDYDRALVELAAFLQRLAIVQIVPEAAQQDEEFDSGRLPGWRSDRPKMFNSTIKSPWADAAIWRLWSLARLGRPCCGMLAFRPTLPTRHPRAPPPPAAAAAPAAGALQAPSGPVDSDASNWPAVLEAAGSGMVRQFALNCVPAKFARCPDAALDQ